MKKQNKKRLHSWMYTLLYPAVLGAMLVAVINAAVREDESALDFKFAFAAFLIAYFSSQHVENTLDRKNYMGWMFVSDAFEILSMFGLFALLGMIRFGIEITVMNGASWYIFHLTLSVAFLLPVGARLLIHKTIGPDSKQRSLSYLSITAAIATLLISPFGVPWILLGILSVVLAIYLRMFVFD